MLPAFQQAHEIVNTTSVQHVLQRILFLELRIPASTNIVHHQTISSSKCSRIIDGMFVVLPGNLREVFWFRA
jgi:hypothetical protein